MIQKSEQPKILLFDIETSPIIGAVWGLWEQNVVKVVGQWYMLSFSYKWLGESKVHSFALPDFKLYSKNKTDDSDLCTELWKLLDEADIVIAHNGDEFDIKKANARFIVNGMIPPSSYLKIDTKKIAKKYFKFDSNSLKDLAKYFGVSQKADAGGIETWFGCMAGNKKSWAHMIEYNKQDVKVLEDVYLRMRPWMSAHPVLRHKEDYACPKCISTNIQKRGYARTSNGVSYQRWQCQDCGGWSRSRKSEEEKANII
jgi:hypothetical protein